MNLRNIAKTAVSSVLRRSLAGIIGQQTGRRVILCFHSVHPNANHSSIKPDDFDKILSWLAENTDLVPVDQLLTLDRGDNPRPSVAITFDDGHRDNLTHALPIVLNYGATFAVYLTVGVTENDPRARKRFSAVLRQPDTSREDFDALSWNDAEKLLDRGCSVGSHSWDHPMLSHLPDHAIDFQLRESKRIIQQRLGISNIGMCYPYGKLNRQVDKRVIEATEKIGYSYGLCVEHRAISDRDSRFAIPRIIINHSNLERLKSQVLGAEDYHGLVSRYTPRLFSKQISPQDFNEVPHAPLPAMSRIGADLSE